MIIPQVDGATEDSPVNGKDDNDDRSSKRSRIDEELTNSTVALPAAGVELSSRNSTGNGDELGSDLDDEDEEVEAMVDENINDLILCQYEKISRVRTRWRGVLRAGIVHVNGSDYCFSRANTDFDW